MHGMNGDELIARIRAEERAASRKPTPAVALTALASPADEQRARSAGFNNFLIKPIDPDYLIAAAASMLKQA